MPLEALSVMPTGVGEVPVVYVNVMTGFVVDDAAYIKIKIADTLLRVAKAATPLHDKANESPMFKLSDVLDDTTVPL